MSKWDKIFIFGVIVCILGMLTITAIQKENLEVENKFLKEENHMLKNALADLGAEIEELSTTIERLEEDKNVAYKWNDNIEGF